MCETEESVMQAGQGAVVTSMSLLNSQPAVFSFPSYPLAYLFADEKQSKPALLAAGEGSPPLRHPQQI